jgi:hypothetical protein
VTGTQEEGPVFFHGRQLLANLAAGARLALFLPVRPHAFRVSALQFTLLVAFNLALWIGVAAVRSGFAGEFDAGAVAAYLSGVPLLLLTALLLALIYKAPERLLAFAVAFISTDPVFELAAFGLPALAGAAGEAVAYAALLGWAWLVSMRAVLVLAGGQRPRLYKSVLVVTSMMVLAIVALPDAEPWYEPREAALPRLASEALFHAQGRLVERSLEGLKPGRRGVPELYFVGFAPDASADVFLREMRYVKRSFDERFRAAGRSIALVSSEEALEEFPIGSATNLARALSRVGEAMNAEEDVLFLFLSAHGNAQHRLSASQPPLELAPVTPTSLARMLQESRIKWRIIVVSACYSGGYIEPLRDANTVVITAAAADRISFGCEHGRDFTYFGEAYFKDALARSDSFIEAFHLARRLVSEKEAAEKLVASRPQIWVGEAIAAQLQKFPYEIDQQGQHHGAGERHVVGSPAHGNLEVPRNAREPAPAERAPDPGRRHR